MNIHEQIQKRFGISSDIGKSIAGNETLQGILARRSVRRFKPEPLPDDLLQTLFGAAFSSPSKSDLQQACVIRVEDPEKKRRIAHHVASTHWIEKAPLFLVWCGDNRRIRKLCEWRGHPFANDHLDAFFNASVDAAIAMQTFIIAAESMGLGCCPVSEVRNEVERLSSELQLPKWVFPVAGLCVGWPADRTQVRMRLPLDLTVHTDRFEHRDLKREVSDYDQRREAVEPTPPDRQRNTERFGVSDHYGWSENRTRQYAVPARENFGRYIRAQGFNLE